MLTETQIKVIIILLDNEGHAGWELAEFLEKEDSNLNRILKKLLRKGIICQGEARSSRKTLRREGDYREYPYYLSNNLEFIKTIIKEIVQSDKVLDTGFVLELIKSSKYIRAMKKRFGKDLTKTIADELRESYPPYADPRFDVIQRIFNKNSLPAPFLEDDLERHPYLLSSPGFSEIERWYRRYLRMRDRLEREASIEAFKL